MNKQPTNQPPEGLSKHLYDICAVCGGRRGLHNNMNQRCPKDINSTGDHTEYRDTVFSAAPPATVVNPSGLQGWEGIAKTIMLSIDHYREAGRDDNFNVQSIADYLKRCFSPPYQPLGIEVKEKVKEAVTKIFYSPATNGKAEESIQKGVESILKLISVYAASQSSTELLKKAHWHGWMVRERYTGPDRHGYEGKLPANWSEMDYDEHEDWFAEQFLLSINQNPQSSTSEEESIEDDWHKLIADIRLYENNSEEYEDFIEQLKSTYKISKI